MMDLEKLELKLEKKKEEYDKISRQMRDLKWEYERAIEIPRKQKMVGKCFKYRNRMSGDNPSWWLYIRVLRLDKTTFIGHSFETDCNKETSVIIGKRISDAVVDSSIKITKTEYKRAAKQIEKKAARLSL